MAEPGTENDADSASCQVATPDDSSETILGCESTETGDGQLLQSRLEEQTQLLMILKQSTEDTDAKCFRLEEENRKLANIRDTEEQKLQECVKKLAKSMGRLKTITLKFEDMSTVVDVYSQQNKELTSERIAAIEENERLFQTAEAEATQQIEKLTNTHEELRDDCVSQEKTIREQKQANEMNKSEYRFAIGKLKKTHKVEVKVLVDNLQSIKASLDENEAHLEKEEEDFMFATSVPETIMKLEAKNKSLLSKQATREVELLVEQNKVDRLQTSVDKLEEKIEELNATFERQAAAVQEKEEVKDLQTKIKDAENQLKQTQEEIEKYKKESQEKLQHERELNQKLRHIP